MSGLVRAVSSQLPEVLGTNELVKLEDGSSVRVIQLNNAATTPPFRHTMDTLDQFIKSYGALHRGTGPHASSTVDAVDEAVSRIKTFIGCPDSHELVFTQNTSVAINLLARMCRLKTDDTVAISEIEHTSNALPWQYNTPAKVVTIKADKSGALDIDDLRLMASGGRLTIVAITGASNLTGFVTDVRRASEMAHAAGAQLFVDAAQLAPHRPINMALDGIDMLAFSAHKLYAPFGLGVLAVPRSLLDAVPVDPGGGSIDMISDQEICWTSPDERHQTGTWNAVGIVALGASCEAMDRVGWDAILKHERRLVAYTAPRLAEIDGLTMHVPADHYVEQDRIGAFPFTLDGYHHSLLTAILEREYGLELRSGTICNHRLVRRWFEISDAKQSAIEAQIRAGDRLATYGVVRASLGVHNTEEDIDVLLDALVTVRKNGTQLQYRPLPDKEAYEPYRGERDP